MAGRGKRVASEAELRRFLQAFPATDVLELLIPDMAGVLRGKRARGKEFAKVFRKGFCLPGGTVLLDTLGDVIPNIAFSATDGDPDLEARVVSGTLAPVPWASRPTGQALFRFFGRDGSPFFADPRQVLERAAQPLAAMKLKIVMAAELEFYLLDGKAEKPTPRAAKIPGLGRQQFGPQVYQPDDLWDIDNFLNEVNDACTAQRIPVGTTTSEFAAGQFEINLQHVDDPVLACDHAVLLKRIIKAIARRHGLVACFMAKPFESSAGSGLHIHLSLVDRQGRNYFSGNRETAARPPFSAKLRHAVGGLAKTMADATAIFAPNANSYRRLRPEAFAPVEPNWGTNHRNVSLRIPVSDARNLRVEHRTAGADANPYLVTAAILAGLHHGLKNRCDPGRMVEEGEILHLKHKLPARWDAAIDRFARSRILPSYLGEDYCKSYAANRRDEASRFHNTVSNVDYEWYLRPV